MISQTERILGESTGMRGQIAGYAIAGVAQGLVFAALIPLLSALVDGQLERAWLWLALAAAGALVSGIALMVTSHKGYYVGIERVTDALMRRIAKHVMQLPLGWFSARRAGELSSVMSTSLQNAMNVPVAFLQQLVIAVTTPVTVGVVILFVDWRLALAMAAAGPLAWILYRRVQRRTAPEHAAEGAAHAAVTARIVEFAQAQPVLRAAGRTEEGWTTLERELDADRAATRRSLNRGQRPLADYMLVIEAGLAVVVILSVYLVLGGEIGVGETVGALLLTVRFTEPLTHVAAYGNGIQLARAALDEVSEILRAEPLPEPHSPQQPHDGSIEFRNVTFGYDATTVLRNVSFTCKPGSLTALVGPSGSGKSTVLRLIARFWDVSDGSVVVGRQDVRDLPAATLMREISMVFQDVYLFDGTIADNIRMGNPTASDADVAAVVTQARLDEVVDRLPDGLETRVGEGGSRLSGGERQRVSIARALLKNTPIVLLDEATAALDADNEAAVTAALAELARERTVVVIAHRLPTIMAADQIVVLERGAVLDVGSHDDLLNRNGLYQRLWEQRRDASGWRITQDR
ncbi:ABC transporter ATP-binding protein [Hoyosella altamirensis]|uniref:ATP-binding cassette subfamily B protein n=1 Tax=Hoyosella altamirensis TaxID=616997 RepID=A0A839RLI9_9ACTN|nr:ABC transporter ATP-binding protein [Hoyosella altamirensis]MBB3037024.1 ATP-binding cassette subfamily B protein [Hoyosella altamirensis]